MVFIKLSKVEMKLWLCVHLLKINMEKEALVMVFVKIEYGEEENSIVSYWYSM